MGPRCSERCRLSALAWRGRLLLLYCELCSAQCCELLSISCCYRSATSLSYTAGETVAVVIIIVEVAIAAGDMDIAADYT